MAADFRLRSFAIADYREVRPLWLKAEGVGLSESDTRPAVAAYLKRNPGLSLVAIAGGRIVGAVLCGHDGRRGYLHHLAVAPAWRRKGIARSIVAHCLASLAKLGIPRCNLFLYQTNVGGEAFWNHLGWKVRTDLKVMQCVTKKTSQASRGC
jgi:ribosomal protein S18 acetylase RimI-like enzyme